MSDSLGYLFPVPSLPPSRLSPGHSPGVSPESTEALQSVLEDNHVNWHVFFNELRYHNHAAHRAIAAWALGVDADIIHKAYKKDCGYEKPAIESPELISADNFDEHLGDDRYYSAYVQFFVRHVKDYGVGSTIEEFVLTRKANLGSDPNQAEERQPQMLNRFLAGALHPLIHTGYSAEFSLPGMLVEGLAQTAVVRSVPGLLEPLLLFEDSLSDASSKISLDSTLSKLVEGKTTSGSTAKDDPHALTILARVLCDPKFRSSPADSLEELPYDKTIDLFSKDIASYVNAWNIDPAILEDGGWEKKVEEIVWAVVVLYGIAGWTHGEGKPGGFLADFFFMHLITSSIFLPSLCALISPVSRSRLLKTYLAVACIWAIARGQPTLDVKGFLEATEPSANMVPTDPDAAIQSSGRGDLWDKILEEARVPHDTHLTKIIRSLSGWSSVFGTRRARLPLKRKADSVNSSEKKEADYLPPTELAGSEYLDGSLFLRVATLTVQRMGWDFQRIKEESQEKEKHEDENWDFDGFFES